MSDLANNLVTEEENKNDAGEDAGEDPQEESGGLKWWEILLIVFGVVAGIFFLFMLFAD